MEYIVRKLEEEQPPRYQEPDEQGRRTITIDVEAETMERQLKRGIVKGGSGVFEVYCDEGPRTGGDSSAPAPLSYFSIGIAF